MPQKLAFERHASCTHLPVQCLLDSRVLPNPCRPEQIELTVLISALDVMHPMLSDRQTNVVPNTDVAHNGVYQQIAKTSRREHTGCCGWYAQHCKQLSTSTVTSGLFGSNPVRARFQVHSLPGCKHHPSTSKRPYETAMP